jgi:SAM-dependent methyltransferase
MQILNDIYIFGFSSIYFLFLIIFGISLVLAFVTKIPFVPTPRRTAKKLIEIANIKENQNIYDLGCGDGRLLFLTEKSHNINATGFEISPIPYLISIIKKFFLKSKVNIVMKSFLREDLSQADVIFIYLIPDIMPRLTTKIKEECKKGTRIISHTFKAKGLTPIKTYPKDTKLKLPQIYVYEI